MRCPQSAFNHNQAIFHLGQCDKCYSKRTIEDDADNDQQIKQDRKIFAMAAMQGLLSNPGYMQGLETNYRANVITDMNSMAAREAIDMADELLKQLNNTQSPQS